MRISVAGRQGFAGSHVAEAVRVTAASPSRLADLCAHGRHLETKGELVTGRLSQRREHATQQSHEPGGVPVETELGEDVPHPRPSCQ
jgi:hypothetical protein